jgi:MFS family permease
LSLDPASLRAIGAATAAQPRALLARPNYRRLWLAGGVLNSMRWLELLVVGIFTFNQTGSAHMVAVVTVARTLPLLFLGALTGVIGEALNRKRLLLGGLLTIVVTATVLGSLAASGQIQIWHIILGGLISGTVGSGEMAVRRRMVGEVVGPDELGRAIAFDSLSTSLSRMIGPLLGGLVFQSFGLGGAYLISAVLHLAAAIGIARLALRQERGALSLARLPADLAEGFALVRNLPIVQAVVLVSILTNVFAFSYTALVAPIGLDKFGVSPALVGLLGAAEPLGAVIGGLVLSVGWLGADHPRLFIGGSFGFLAALIVMALSPWFSLAFLALLIGGLGTARYSTMQTSLILTGVPTALRSRVMGLVSMCIGTGPLGALAVGALSEAVGPPTALVVMALIGLTGLAIVRLRIAELRR